LYSDLDSVARHGRPPQVIRIGMFPGAIAKKCGGAAILSAQYVRAEKKYPSDGFRCGPETYGRSPAPAAILQPVPADGSSPADSLQIFLTF